MIHNGNGTSHTPSRPRSFADVFPRHDERRIADAVEQLVANQTFFRRELSQHLTDPRRDLRKECGYPEVIQPQHYQDAYERNPVAGRVVEVWPEECWQVQPSVYEVEDGEVQTPFEQAWDELGKSLRGGKSWHSGEEGSAVWSYLKDVDVKSRIGRYGVLLLGLDDGLPLDQPAAGVEEQNSGVSVVGPSGTLQAYSLAVNAEKTANRKLLYVRALPESLAAVTRWETNESSPRYCQPVEYTITLHDPSALTSSGNAPPANEKKVHWTRVIHVAEADVFHTPAMQPVFDCLLDIKKILGSAAEAMWKNGQNKLILQPPAEWGNAVDIDVQEVKDQLEKFWNSQDPGLILKGLQATTLPPGVADPTSQMTAQLQAICVRTGVPLRFLLGAEEGKQASDQDTKRMKRRVGKRRNDHCSPRLIQLFADRLIMVGVLPEPAQYTVYWPDLESLSEQEQANVGLVKVQTIAAYEAGAKPGMARQDFWTDLMGKTDEEARSVIANADAEAEETRQKQMADTAEKISQGLMPDPSAQPPGRGGFPRQFAANVLHGGAWAPPPGVLDRLKRAVGLEDVWRRVS